MFLILHCKQFIKLAELLVQARSLRIHIRWYNRNGFDDGQTLYYACIGMR